MYKNSPKSLVLAGAFSIATLLSVSSNATIVEFETSQGNFKINLHDQTTPTTVENFLKYINDGDFNNTVVHRLVPNFIMQAGGFEFNGNFPLTAIDVDSSIKNEPLYSNVRATIAMAKVGNSPNSATSQWFINYKDNSANLDIQNGGFTVFGEVIEGMDNIDKIALLPICQSIPMPDYTDEQCANSNFVPANENFVTIRTVTISNSSTTTAESLSPVKNTLINQESSSSDSSGGGSLSYFALLGLSLVGLRRKMKIS
ncbi:peptidylprolyl isomerase [Colwellia sp. BRX8-7]|jgi:peptidyl-prolyl cis-trans isomerase A (cyclophilin A)|uniref:peptidylprolyl isomerase n=1 Tax=Colwellia sp. BRX8-7 TaxID=2759833 RepID=UPI0015F42A35|nr:peptidylprolyl isomerase [Colwellia sp. BRX8-7]MBA6337742.1 peptidylprolyl isomerase [Colwellia sp. BRX8-7]